tara:strand:+ start:1506 stop:1994 length:489 start_codon:yes stop_codon:yes gene_type:complete
VLKPNRKRLSIDQDAAPGNRRGCLVTGAILGVLAGFIVGLFVIPPLINRYFADNPIQPGQPYEAENAVITLQKVSVVGEILEVELIIDAFSDWKPVHTDFTIKFSDDEVFEALPVDPKVPLTELTFLAGESRTLLLRFPRFDLTIYGAVLLLADEDAQFLFP